MMKKNRTPGFVTLAVTLVLTLAGSYLFFQSADSANYTVMRYQNTLSAKKNHWAAEGGLACAYGVNKTTAGTPMSRDYSLCDERVLGGSLDDDRLQLSVTPTEVVSGALYTLSSEAKEAHGRGKRSVMRDIQLSSGAPMPGVFKTSSRLRLTGSFDLLPNKNTNESDENECISLIIRNKSEFLHTDSVVGSKLIVRDCDGYQQNQLPSGVKLSDVNNSAVDPRLGFECKSGYQTFQQVGAENIPFAKDVREDPNMDMFQDLFGVPKDQWETVRDSKFDVVIKADANNSLIEDCAQQVAAAFNQGKKKIWVEGSCYVQSPPEGEPQLPFNFSNPESAMLNNQVMLVIQDGVVFSPTNLGFSGLLYQFNTGLRESSVILADMIAACWAGGLCTATPHEKDYKNRAFFINGALYTFGGVAVDMEGMDFNINGSMVATYDSSKWEGLLTTPTGTDVRWKEGTWRDF